MATTLTAPATERADLLEAMITAEGPYKGKQVFLPSEFVLSATEERELEAAFDEMEEAARQMMASAEALTESLDKLHEAFVEVNRKLDE